MVVEELLNVNNFHNKFLEMYFYRLFRPKIKSFSLGNNCNWGWGKFIWDKFWAWRESFHLYDFYEIVNEKHGTVHEWGGGEKGIRWEKTLIS